jgi:alanyl-tRNA synthetase
MDVFNTVKTPADIIVSKGTVLSGGIALGDTVELKVDRSRRSAIARNHTATHLLHAVLREIVGDHVKQSGSLVAPDRLRFDFTHFSALDSETLQAIEQRVNEKIRENTALEVEEMDADSAFNSGATALFEEKYGDRVRVVEIGDFSKELCGGTHTERTGDIGLFKIISESSVAAGVRRIEAFTGEGAFNSSQEAFHTMNTLADLLKSKPEDLIEKVEKVLADHKALEKEVAALKAKMLTASSVQEGLADVKKIDGVPVLVREVSAETPSALRDLGDQLKSKLQSGIIVLGSKTAKKVMLVVVVTDDLLEEHHAGKLIKKIATIVGGGGGGRPDMAQAGGSKPEKLSDALASVENIIAKK